MAAVPRPTRVTPRQKAQHAEINAARDTSNDDHRPIIASRRVWICEIGREHVTA
jgi:hypothetical protein